MSTLGTFDSFTTMRLGIYAAQQGLRVTGNNISNINTVGYTRQRIDQVSFKTGGSDRYASMIDKRVGNGVLVSGINQIRDPFLDIRYRNASNDTYHYDTWLGGMQDIAAILDEVGKGANDGDGLLYAQLQDLRSKLLAYSANPTPLNDRLVRQSASSLTDLFHSAANRLDRLYADTQVDFGNSITAVNEILVNIRELDKSIREAEIHGDMALELRDERNLQIDKLSQYVDIKVEYSYEDVGSGIQVERLTIKLNNANPDKNVTSDEAILVDGLYCTQLSVPDEKPLANTYDTSLPQYAYLKGYSYLKEYSPADLEELQKFLNKNGLTSADDLIKAMNEDGTPKLDANGNQIYLIGTNSVDEAVKVENDNYTIQLGKLLNSKGVEWENSTTTWAAVTGTTMRVNQWAATFDTYVGLTAGKSFTINGTTYNIIDDGTDPNGTTNPVYLSQVKTPEALAEFVFKNYNFKTDNYSAYNIELSGNKIIFTAKEPGYNTPPALNDDPETNDLFDVDVGAATEVPVVGPPADINLNDYPQITVDEYGNKTTINYVQVGDQWYKLTVRTEYTREIALDDNDLKGIIQAQRELLTEEGEFASEYDVALDENALTKRGIKYYQKSLDLLAQKLAEAYNQLNVGYAYNQNGNYIKEDGTEITIPELLLDENGDPVFDNGNPVYVDTPLSIDGLTKGQRENVINNDSVLHYIYVDDDGYLTDEKGNQIKDENGAAIQAYDEDGNFILQQGDYDKAVLNMNQLLEDYGGWKMGGVLFSNGNNGDDTTGINAHNIDISYGWSNGKWDLVPTFMMLFTEDGGLAHSTQNINADHMVAMIDNALVYNPRDLADSDAIGPVLFEGSFNDMFSNMMAVEAEDERKTTVQLNTSAAILEDLDYRREGVSGVDLNDEAMNMVQYQKAMNAAMRLMTAIDEALDRLISNTGVAGR